MNIPTKKIKNSTYANQSDCDIIPLIKEIKEVWINKISPVAKGWFICVNMNLNNILAIIIKNLISGNILFEILILGINEKVLPFLWSLKRASLIFGS